MKHRMSCCKTGQLKLLVLLTTFLHIINSGRSQFVPPKCSKVCGISAKEANYTLPVHENERHSSLRAIDTGGNCAHNTDIAAWNASSRGFLSSIGMSDSLYECPRLSAVQRRPNDTEIPASLREYLYNPLLNISGPNYKLSKQKIVLPTENNIHPVALDSVPATCNIRVDRGVLRRTSSGQITISWIVARKYSGLAGWIFGLLDESTSRFRAVRVPTDLNDSCRGNSCHRYSAFWFVSNATTRSRENKFGVKHENKFSMFTDWQHVQVPGMTFVVEKLKEGVSKLDSVDNDLSASNLAILCLPILMAIPPISLLTEVSNTATVWYMFATDVLAILPLFIKGMELIKTYSDARVNLYSTLSMIGREYGLFERWDIRCIPRDFKTDTIGKVIVLSCAWFMSISVYSEVVFWQRAKHNRKSKGKKVVSNLNDGEILELNHYLSLHKPVEVEETDSNQKSRRDSAIRYTISFSLSASIVTAVPFTQHLAVLCGSIVLLVLLRAVVTRQLRRFLGWKYLADFVFGFFTGPLYFILHSFESVRESKDWEDVSDGACAGFASSAMGLSFWFMQRPVSQWPFEPFCLFVWIFGCSLVLAHVLRNLDEDKVLWRCFGHGIAVGALFGPLGFLMKRWICEIGTNEQAQTYFFLGFGFGLNLLASVTICVVNFIQPPFIN